MLVRSVSFIPEHGSKRFFFCRVCSLWALVSHSTTHAQSWKLSSTINLISRARPSTASSANPSHGGVADIVLLNRCCRWRNWGLQFISPISSGSRLRTDSSSQCRFCLCFRAVSYTFVLPLSRADYRRSLLAARARPLQFLRDKHEIIS